MVNFQMRITLRFWDSEKFSNSANWPNLGFGTMRLLAQDAVPESARQEALEKSESGEKLTIKKVIKLSISAKF